MKAFCTRCIVVSAIAALIGVVFFWRKRAGEHGQPAAA
jgi:hypothetical protein